ncbi:MAG TPA: metalloregulator ArsR/SmtB family transcription factor, partial [Ktedonobacterales bacterium]|nr:metalloregulator ArsR/SmtB family transcription factor [Ktedonobacterales bacterium]
MMRDEYPRLEKRLQALSDPFRLNILHLLATHEEMPVGDIVRALGKSQPLVSFHLRQLHDVGLVRKRQRGRQTYYALDDEQVAQCQQMLTTLIPPRQAHRPLAPDLPAITGIARSPDIALGAGPQARARRSATSGIGLSGLPGGSVPVPPS